MRRYTLNEWLYTFICTLTEPTVTQYSPFLPITTDYHLKTFTTPPSPVLAVPDVTDHPSTATVESPYCRPTNENTHI